MMKLVVFSCLVAAASAGVILTGYGAPIAYSAPLLAPVNYRGPLSLAPGQPANVLGADGRPLDTLDVNLDRSAHYTAKAFEGAGIHLLKKRSASLLAAPYFATGLTYSAPLLTHAAAPLAYSTPIASAAYAPALSHISYAAPLAHTLIK